MPFGGGLPAYLRIQHRSSPKGEIQFSPGRQPWVRLPKTSARPSPTRERHERSNPPPVDVLPVRPAEPAIFRYPYPAGGVNGGKEMAMNKLTSLAAAGLF